MINLLPPETKAQIAAARTNRLLLRYNVLLLVALAFLLASIVIVYFYLTNAKAGAEEAIADSRAKVSDYSAVETEANNFRQSLASAKQILDSDVAYTRVILEIANVLPSGIVLDTLNLDSATFGSPMVMTANAKDYAAILALKDSLQSSSVFSNVSIQSIASGTNGAYPLTASFSVTIRKDAGS